MHAHDHGTIEPRVRQTKAMADFRWFNQSQPQTLQTATIFLYIGAAFALIGGIPSGIGALFALLAIGGGASAWGIANSRKWGYISGIVVAVAPFAYDLMGIAHIGVSFGITFNMVVALLIQAAIVTVLLHPMSREHVRVWFK